MAPTRKVTSIPGTYSFEGKSYGPFEAANSKDFQEVPADFADALGLPLHESEVTEAEAQAAEGDDLAAKFDWFVTRVSELEAERDTLTAQLAEAQAKLTPPEGAAGQTEGALTSVSLPADFPMRDLLLSSGFDSLGKVRAGLQDGTVDKVSGIGPATLKTIEAALK